MTAPLHITLVGCGSMGHAILSAWVKRFDPGTKFTVIIPHKDSVKDLTYCGRIQWKDPKTVTPFKTDLIFFAVKPDMLEKVLTSYVDFDPKAFLSIAAGKPISFYQKILPPQIPFIRLMPNTPAAAGQGMTALFTQNTLDAALKANIEALIRSFGKLVWLENEDQFHAVTALSASGPAYVFYLTEVMEQAGIEMGLSRDLAHLLARQTVIGAGRYLGENPELAPVTLRQNVTSKGGTTEAAFKILTEKKQFQALIIEAIRAARKRSQEL